MVALANQSKFISQNYQQILNKNLGRARELCGTCACAKNKEIIVKKKLVACR